MKVEIFYKGGFKDLSIKTGRAFGVYTYGGVLNTTEKQPVYNWKNTSTPDPAQDWDDYFLILDTDNRWKVVVIFLVFDMAVYL